ncbi:MAG: hypothetical protein N3B16_06035, partial [Candidatus Aminicenantes bacterium]|nr:hypothetical protein [Candidatus Aminicenantes bacterium]
MSEGKIEEISTIKFVYPFTFEPSLFSNFTGNISLKVTSQEQGESKEIIVWEEDDSFPKDDLIRHVSKYINPTEDIEATAWFLKLNNEFLSSPKYLGSKCDWYLLMRDKKELPEEKIPFQIINIQLALFISGVGLLCLEAKPKVDDTDAWFDFLHYFRFFKGNRSKKIFLQRKIGFDKEKREPIWQPFFPQPCGGLQNHPDGIGQLDEIIDMLLLTVVRDKQRWWDDIYIYGQMLPYVNIFAKEVKEEDKPYFIYKIRNFFHSKQQIFPSRDDLDLNHPNNLHYTQDSLFTFSLDGGAFIYFDAPDTPFFRVTLPDHLKAHYFFLFILALQQRFSLISLSCLVSRYAVEKDEKKKLNIFERIRENLII